MKLALNSYGGAKTNGSMDSCAAFANQSASVHDMQTQASKAPGRILFLFALLLAGVPQLHAQFNDWAITGPGKWEVGTNWSLGTPPGTNDAFDNIFTGSTITIDAITSGSFPNTMTVNYVGIGWPVTFYLDNAGTNVPLHILQNLDISFSSVPEVIITNSALQVDGSMTLGNLSGSAGNFELDSGWAQFGSITLGNSGNGDLFFNGGTLTVLGTMTLANLSGSGGSFIMSGGTLIHTNNSIILGRQGNGIFSVTGGSVRALGFQVGNIAGSQGNLHISGGTVLVSSNILIGNGVVTNPCSVTILTNGTLSVTNVSHTAYVDVAGNGSLTLDGGLLQLDSLILTNGGGFTNLSGTFTNSGAFQVDNGSSLTVAGGTVIAPTNFTVGSVAGSTSSVSVAGGSLIVTNGPLLLGPVGVGQMTIFSNSTVTAETITVGSAVPGASGTLLVNGGSVRVTSLLSVNSTHSVDFSPDGHDITFDGTGANLNVGDDNPGAVNIGGSGTVTFAAINIGVSPGCTGTYEQSGMQVFVNNQMTVGNCVTNGVETMGMVTMSGGALYVTNSTHTAALVVRNGTFALNPGATLVADNLIITNACARFENNGGTLIVNPANIILSPNLDADGDGVSNGAEQAAGTDPLNPSSYFHILSATQSGKDAVLTWVSVTGKSYYVQACTNAAQMKSANFANVSPSVPAGNSGTTTYTVPRGATNPAVFYRIMLAQ